MLERFDPFKKAVAVGLLLVASISAASIILIHSEVKLDAAEYMLLAENLDKLGRYTYNGESSSRGRQPVYPMILSLIYWKLGQSFLVVKLLQALLNLLTFLIIMILLKRLLPSLHPSIPAIIISAYYPLWVFCAYALAESVFIFAIVAFVWLLERGLRTGSAYRLGLSGLVLGLSVLTKPIAIFPLLLIWLPVLFHERLSKYAFASLLYVLLGSCLVLVPWATRNYIECGYFTPLSAEGGEHLMYVSGGKTTESDYRHTGSVSERATSTERKQIAGAVRRILSDPLSVIWQSAIRTVTIWMFFPGTREYSHILTRFASHLVQILILLATVTGLARTRRSTVLLLILVPVSFSLGLIIANPTTRYLIPCMPFVLGGAAVGVQQLAARAPIIAGLFGMRSK